MRLTTCVLLAVCGSVACSDSDVYLRPGDTPMVGDTAWVCGASVDDGMMSWQDLQQRMRLAKARGWVLNLYAHQPGRTVQPGNLERIFAHANAIGLPFVTYDQLVTAPEGGAGLAFAFDDEAVAEWHALRPMYQRYGVKLTMFVSGYLTFDAGRKALLRELAAEGHAVGSHTVDHPRAVAYAREHGVAGYVEQQVVPSIEALTADGFNVQSFAFPYGDHSPEIDEAVAPYVRIMRGIQSRCSR